MTDSEGGLLCSACSAGWLIENGIPRFIEDSFYWGFTRRVTMQTVLEIAEQEGWRRAMDYHVDQQHPEDGHFYREYVCSEERANWRFLLSLSRDSKVLDVGSGWGANAYALSKVVGEVVALDATYENLQFVGIRCGQEGAANVRLVNANVVQHARLPFPDRYFDLAVMIGVLEWVGDPLPQVGAVEAQRRVLKKVARCLTPGGKLYLAIENRFGFNYFLGKPDEHSGLRFVTLLPRRLANVYSEIVRKRPYCTYTHSRKNLRLLLRSSGFSNVSFYAPIPNYVNPSYYVSLESPAAFGALLRLLRARSRLSQSLYHLGQFAIRLGLHRVVCPAFAVVAERPHGRQA